MSIVNAIVIDNATLLSGGSVTIAGIAGGDATVGVQATNSSITFGGNGAFTGSGGVTGDDSDGVQVDQQQSGHYSQWPDSVHQYHQFARSQRRWVVRHEQHDPVTGNRPD
jgi:hypothetical protein